MAKHCRKPKKRLEKLSVRNETEGKTVILLVIIAKKKGTWQSIIGNPRNV
jgi:hypothetical protein